MIFPRKEALTAFQVAGKDTGVDNNLVIYDANLVGMQAT